MKKTAGLLVALIGLAVSFQNCSAKTNFSGTSTSSSVAASGQSGGIDLPAHPVAVATPVPQCTTYVLNGDGSNNGNYTFIYVSTGTKIYQKVACFGRPMDTGYQPSYCSGALVGSCNDCLGAAGYYTCGSNGYWAPSTN